MTDGRFQSRAVPPAVDESRGQPQDPPHGYLGWLRRAGGRTVATGQIRGGAGRPPRVAEWQHRTSGQGREGWRLSDQPGASTHPYHRLGTRETLEDTMRAAQRAADRPVGGPRGAWPGPAHVNRAPLCPPLLSAPPCATGERMDVAQLAPPPTPFLRCPAQCCGTGPAERRRSCPHRVAPSCRSLSESPRPPHSRVCRPAHHHGAGAGSPRRLL